MLTTMEKNHFPSYTYIQMNPFMEAEIRTSAFQLNIFSVYTLPVCLLPSNVIEKQHHLVVMLLRK